MADGNGDPNSGPAARGTTGTLSAEHLVRFWELSLALMGVGNYDGYFTLVNPAYQELLG
ncbi:hypothetical protein [Pseudonocardia sp. H11422]|uniref:hypothetical protein n=1 Tax=Pseudonocardia sp. H11422 TaxID=2835866 RepID=UPI001BDD8262|nr:hypothetical protein [Pseudonocardia sp. H11422]